MSRWRWTSAAACRPSRSWGSPTRRSGSRASACGPRSVTPASSFPRSGSRSALRPPTSRRPGRLSTSGSRPAFWSASGQLPATALEGVGLAGEVALDGALRPIVGALPMALRARMSELRLLGVPRANAQEAALAGLLGANGSDADGPPRVIALDNVGELGALEDADATEVPELGSSVAGAYDLCDLRGQPRPASRDGGGGGRRPQPADARTRRGLASRWRPAGCPRSCLLLGWASRSRRYRWQAPAGPFRSLPPREPGRSAPRITRSPRPVWWGAARRPGPANSAAPTVACSSSTSFPSSRATRSRPCASRSRTGASSSPRPPQHRAPVPDDAGRRREPVPLRAGSRGGGVRVRPVRDPPVPLADQRAARGPDRHHRRGGSAQRRVRSRQARARDQRPSASGYWPRASARRARLGAARCNAEAAVEEIRRDAALDSGARGTLAAGQARLALSGRGYDRVLRLARTVADLAEREHVCEDDVAEALTLRSRGGD